MNQLFLLPSFLSTHFNQFVLTGFLLTHSFDTSSSSSLAAMFLENHIEATCSTRIIYPPLQTLTVPSSFSRDDPKQSGLLTPCASKRNFSPGLNSCSPLQAPSIETVRDRPVTFPYSLLHYHVLLSIRCIKILDYLLIYQLIIHLPHFTIRSLDLVYFTHKCVQDPAYVQL